MDRDLHGAADRRRQHLWAAIALSALAHAAAVLASGRHASHTALRFEGLVHFVDAPPTAVAASEGESTASGSAPATKAPTRRGVRLTRRSDVSAQAALTSAREGALMPGVSSDGDDEGAAVGAAQTAAHLTDGARRTAPIPLDSNPRPTYPRALRRAGIEGTVTARIRVSAGGRIEAIEKLDGPEVFHETVREALARYRYHPATQDGHAVAAVWTLRIPFSLH